MWLSSEMRVEGHFVATPVQKALKVILGEALLAPL